MPTKTQEHNWEPYDWREERHPYEWAKWICRACGDLAKAPHQDTYCDNWGDETNGQ